MESKAEEELRKLSVEIRYLEQTAEALQQRVGMVNTVIADLTYANIALEGLEKEKEGSELLVPIGGSSYVKARLATTDKIIVGMGAGVSIEKTLPEAKDLIKKRLEELQKTRLTLQQQFTQVADKIGQDRQRFEGLVAGMRQEKAQ